MIQYLDKSNFKILKENFNMYFIETKTKEEFLEMSLKRGYFFRQTRLARIFEPITEIIDTQINFYINPNFILMHNIMNGFST